LELDPTMEQTLDRMGTDLAGRFGLRGLFGVDLVLGRHHVWLIEVNPRFTASMEILERTILFSAVALHIDACCHGRLPSSAFVVRDQCEKRIVYASRRMHISPVMTARLLEIAGPTHDPRLADIPQAGSIIETDDPVLTLFTGDGTTIETEVADILTSET
ncbi:MAG TPA: ATP-grasp domain-containing protein, partial [Pirellulales bacterium]|nr:ATP-grasp domain-containing protein [Pirellulales bacterium]